MDIDGSIFAGTTSNTRKVKTKISLDETPTSTGQIVERNELKEIRLCQSFRLVELVPSLLVVIIGVVSGIAVLLTGINNADSVALSSLEKSSLVTVQGFQDTFDKYLHTAALLHFFCTSNTNFTREMYRSFHEVNVGNNLQYQAMEFISNISHSERSKVENETHEFLLKDFPDLANNFTGIKGFNENRSEISKRIKQPFYFPVMFVEPVLGNENAIGFDLYSHPDRRYAINMALTYGRATVSAGIHLVQENTDPNAYGVLLFHPGHEANSFSSTKDNSKLSLFVISIPDLLKQSYPDVGASDPVGASRELYLFDSTNLNEDLNPSFLGSKAGSGSKKIEYSEIKKLCDSSDFFYFEKTVSFAQADWTIVIIEENSLDHSAVILGCSLVIAFSVLLAFGIIYMLKHTQQIAAIKSRAKDKDAKMKLRNEQEKKTAERDLNNFIAHQIKNPLSAAINATSFAVDTIKRCLKESKEKQDDRDGSSVDSGSIVKLEQACDDILIVDNSLKFINHLLGNTLDLHQAQRGRIEMKYGRVNLLKDILEPVQEVLQKKLYQNQCTLLLFCSAELCITGDCARLKQIVMAIASNASNFVTKGFIRFKAIPNLTKDAVDIIIEDSGKGITSENHGKLFRTNEIDNLQVVVTQYSGIGLCLCEKLVKTMNGDIWIDESYNSGIPDFPGTRLVVRLRTEVFYGSNSSTCNNPGANLKVLPDENMNPSSTSKNVKVLLVDDDMVLRKLFKRLILRCHPEWQVDEAPCGEEAIRKIEHGNVYTMIFMDQYMTGTEKRLLGTEAVKQLRLLGEKTTIIGLSANNIEDEFYDAGANFFARKPFPCEKNDCEEFLTKCLHAKHSSCPENSPTQQYRSTRKPQISGC